MAADLRISKHTRQHHLSLILELFGYRMIDQPTRLTLEERALAAARISNRPVYALRPSDRPSAATGSEVPDRRAPQYGRDVPESAQSLYSLH